MDYSFVSTAITRRRPLNPSKSRSNDSSSKSQHQQQRCLKRSLNLMDLIFYGVGCSVGAGIYSLVGIGAHLAGPSIALSFFLCGIACCFTSLAYAEFAARVPLAGSAYTFTYVSFGELCGWLVGWNLTLGYAISAAVVARSWAEYLVGFVQGVLPGDTNLASWTTHLSIPFISSGQTQEEKAYDCCPLAMVIIGLCTVVLITGVKESTKFNTAMTVLNLSVLVSVLLAGVSTNSVHPDNLTPVFPHGIPGMARGAGLVFFSYLGFDMVACLSEEVQNPTKNMPIGIIGSLLLSMTIYVSVSVVVVGMAPIQLLGEETPITNALVANACCFHEDQLVSSLENNACLRYDTCSPILHPVLYFGSRIVSFGAIFGLTTATFACLMGQPRIFYSMAQDGLLFKIYGRVHPKTGVPTIGTVLTGIVTALIACFVNLESLANVISLGTLQVFTFVNAGVIILRMQPPDENDNGHDLDDKDHAPLESSPLVRSPVAATVARSLGLVKQTSRQIKEGSLRSSLNNDHSSQQWYSFSSGSSGQFLEDVHQNGSKPHALTFGFTVCSTLASVGVSNGWQHKELVMGLVVFGIFCLVRLSYLPRSRPPDTFSCPMVPFVPLCGIVCNSYMMGSMPGSTWLFILVWLLAGLAFYFGYGIHHSELQTRQTTNETITGAELVQVPITTGNLLHQLNRNRGGYDTILPSTSSLL